MGSNISHHDKGFKPRVGILIATAYKPLRELDHHYFDKEDITKFNFNVVLSWKSIGLVLLDSITGSKCIFCSSRG